jgi:site-specific DNA-methyltransferase (adenine-specific)
MMKTTQKLILGDCLEILHSVPDDSIDLVLTDIPYGKNFVSAKQTSNTRDDGKQAKRQEAYFQSIIGDDFTPTEWLIDAYRIMKNNTAMYCFIDWKHWSILEAAVIKAGFQVKNMIVMNKSNHGQGDIRGTYAPKHELVMYATKGRHLLHFPVKRLNDVVEAKVLYSGSKRHHPMQKPTHWLEPFILCSSNPGDVVLDPYVGSGSTIVTCKQLSRNGIGIDVDPVWIKVAKERLNEGR